MILPSYTTPFGDLGCMKYLPFATVLSSIFLLVNPEDLISSEYTYDPKTSKIMICRFLIYLSWISKVKRPLFGFGYNLNCKALLSVFSNPILSVVDISAIVDLEVL